MKIAALLTVHDRKEKTLKCLQSLFSQRIPSDFNLDVFMTDDGCTDGTPQSVSVKYPTVNIIRGDGSLYWNRGMYLAWETASKHTVYDFYLWLNDDTILLEDSLFDMLSEASCTDNAVIIGSTCDSTNFKDLTYGGISKGKRLYPNGRLQDCETFNGNIVLIPNYVFQKIGNLDWTYSHAIGDFDYGWMVTRAGLKNYVSKDFRGTCDKNPQMPKWMRYDVPFKQRWKNFHSPLGYSQPGQFFHFNRKNFGICKAILILISNHIRVFFPWLWSK